MVDIKIDEENFKLIDPSLLLQSQAYSDVEHMVGSIVAASTADYAREYIPLLADKLIVVGDRLSQDLLVKYLRLLKVLKLVALRALSEQEEERLFREQILDVFKFDFVDVKEQVELIFRSYWETPEIIEDFRKRFLIGLENNQEELGKQNLSIQVGAEDKIVKPTLKNWFYDYNTSAHIDAAANNRSGYQQVKYLTGSKNVGRLDKFDREVLLKIFQFYDWLKFDPLRYNFHLPGEQHRQSEILDIDRPLPLIPDEIIESINKLRLQPGKNRLEQDSDLLKTDGRIIAELPISAHGAVRKEIAQQAVTKGVDAQNVLRGRQVTPPLKEKSQVKSIIDIDQKLEELSKKVKKRLGK